MELLKALNDAFNDYPKGSVKTFLAEQREKLGDRDFNQVMFYHFGGREYNKFLDYKLLAIKLCKLFEYPMKIPYINNEYSNESIVTRLFFDDRHDMYQNIPYYIQDIIEANPDKIKEINSIIAYALIDCFNVYGTGDKLSEEITVKEN